MDIRDLGKSGLRTPRLVLGGNVFGWTASGAEAFRILDRFVEAGGTMIDTADVYSAWVPGHKGGESERLIGEWLRRRGRRDDVLIATKVGFSEGLSAGVIERGIEASLERLGTTHIDLYYSHKDDPGTPFEETIGAFDRLVRAGKVRAIGASQISAERLEEALAASAGAGLVPYTVLQTWYNMMERPPSRRRWPASRRRMASACCPSTASPTASSPASIAARPTLRRASAATAWRNI